MTLVVGLQLAILVAKGSYISFKILSRKQRFSSDKHDQQIMVPFSRSPLKHSSIHFHIVQLHFDRI